MISAQVPTTYTSTSTNTGCVNPADNSGPTTSSGSGEEDLLPPFLVQGANNNGLLDGVAWQAFQSPQWADVFTVINGASDANGSTYSPASISDTYPLSNSAGGGVVSYTETYSASVSGVNISENWVGTGSYTSTDPEFPSQTFKFILTSTYNIVSGIQMFSYSSDVSAMTSGDPSLPGCVGQSAVIESGSTSFNWFASSVNSSAAVRQVRQLRP